MGCCGQSLVFDYCSSPLVSPIRRRQWCVEELFNGIEEASSSLQDWKKLSVTPVEFRQ